MIDMKELNIGDRVVTNFGTGFVAADLLLPDSPLVVELDNGEVIGLKAILAVLPDE